jgi:hypothetical protein
MGRSLPHRISPDANGEELRTDLLAALRRGKTLSTAELPEGTMAELRSFQADHRNWVDDTQRVLVIGFFDPDPASYFGRYTPSDEFQGFQADEIKSDVDSRLHSLRDIFDLAFPDSDGAIPQSAPAVDANILVSWSKPISHEIAERFYEWLPKVLPGAKPWISSNDIDKGALWFSELQTFLLVAKVCVIFVTKENSRSPWLFYESGAISVKGPQGMRICTYVVGDEPSILSDGPLGQYQATRPDLDDTWRLMRSLNKAMAAPTKEEELRQVFDSYWPSFKGHLDKALDAMSSLKADDQTGVVTEAERLAGWRLSSEARTILIEASSGDGTIITSESLSGYAIQINGENVAVQANIDARAKARWKGAVRVLLNAGLAEAAGESGQVLDLTDRGYEVADLLVVETS